MPAGREDRDQPGEPSKQGKLPIGGARSVSDGAAMVDVEQGGSGGAGDDLELLVRSARLARSRGRLLEAEEILRRVLTAEASNRDASLVLGEVLLDRGDATSARDLLKSSLDRHPGDAVLEAAYARAVLAVSEDELARNRAYTQAVRKGTRHSRSPAIPPLASALICGAGQLLNEEIAKGLLLAGVGYLSLLLGMLAGGKALIGGLASWILGGRAAASTGHVSGLAVFLLIVAALAWIVSIVDAGLVARGSARPPATPTGWEV